MHVQELLIYPVKSCAGIQLTEALVTKYGLASSSDTRIFDRLHVESFIGIFAFFFCFVLSDDGW